VKRAFSAKNFWESSPRALRLSVGRVLGLLPPEVWLGRRFRRCVRFALEAQYWLAERAREYQLAMVREIVRLAYERTPFYRRLFRSVGFEPGDLKTLDDLRALPTVDKEVIRSHLDQMLALPASHPGVDFISTGGTSGVPLHFYIGKERSSIEYAYLTVSWQRAGYRLGMPMAVLRGRVVRPERNGFLHDYDPVFRHHFYSNFHMTDENMRRYLAHIRTIGPCFLHMYPSSAATLARFCLRSGVRPPSNIRGIIAESETVYPDQRQVVEQVFGCRYFSCYGHTEKLVLAAECEHSADYHVWPTYGFLELVDAHGRPVTEPGQRGEIVGTGFINRVVPFIRYRTGDYATYVADRCEACGREHVLIRDIAGRSGEALIAEDGSEIFLTGLYMHDDTFRNVRQFQFYQDTPGKVVLRLVPGDGFNEDDRGRIGRRLAAKLNGRIEVEIEVTQSIRLSPRGKAIYIDQRVPRKNTPAAGASGRGV